MKKYYTPAVYITSIAAGIISYIVSTLFFENGIALLIGLSVIFCVSLIIPAAFAISDVKYNALKKGIPAPFIIDERVSCVIGNSLKNGFIVLSGDTLFLMTYSQKKPIRYEIKKSEIKKISISENIYLNIFFDYNKYIRIASGNCSEIMDKLKRQGFGRS